jgi:hypothetical protein
LPARSIDRPEELSMTSSEGHEAEPVGRDDLADALPVLRAATRWRLAPSRWTRIERSAAAMLTALAVDDGPALRAGILDLELLGPVRTAAAVLAVPAPGELLAQLTALIDVLAELEGEAGRRQPEAGARLFPATISFPVSIYLGEETGHELVEAAVDELARSAGLTIDDRDEPVLGSWFRRMRARLTGAARSPAAQDALADLVQRTELEVVLRPEAEVTAHLMASLAPLITSMERTRDAVVRVGAVLIVKNDGALFVNQLTTRQQVILNHSPHLLAAPDTVLSALGLPRAEAAAIPADPA